PASWPPARWRSRSAGATRPTAAPSGSDYVRVRRSPITEARDTARCPGPHPSVHPIAGSGGPQADEHRLDVTHVLLESADVLPELAELRVEPIQPLVDGFESLVDAVESLVDGFESLVDAVEAVVDVVEPVVHPDEPLVHEAEPGFHLGEAVARLDLEGEHLRRQLAAYLVYLLE